MILLQVENNLCTLHSRDIPHKIEAIHSWMWGTVSARSNMCFHDNCAWWWSNRKTWMQTNKALYRMIYPHVNHDTMKAGKLLDFEVTLQKVSKSELVDQSPPLCSGQLVFLIFWAQVLLSAVRSNDWLQWLQVISAFFPGVFFLPSITAVSSN